MNCELMSRLLRIEGIESLPPSSLEKVKRLICGAHNGVCKQEYLNYTECKTKNDEQNK